MHLTATPSEVAQMLASATSKQGLNREAWVALLRVITRPECPEGNLLPRGSNPNCWIAREEKKRRRRRKRERTFPGKTLT